MVSRFPELEGHCVYISSDCALKEFVAPLDGCDVLAIDTEFLREKTYYPQLCLLQLATRDMNAIVDPIAIGDLTPLVPILTDPAVVKVFHAGSQDREILFQACGVAAAPVFDTQLAAAFLGFPQQVGYAPLVLSYCDVALPKTDSLTDWSQRPLTAGQLDYALDDVLYLPRIYDEMTARLDELGRREWLDEDFEEMGKAETYRIDPNAMWKKVRRVSSLTTRQLVCARALADWREREAQRRNLPRKWVLSDEFIVEVARRQPKSVNDLYKVRGVQKYIRQRSAEELVATFKKDLSDDPSTWPTRRRKKGISRDVDATVDLMNTVMHIRAKENLIAPQMLGGRDDLESIAGGYPEDTELTKGWRYDVVGRELQEVLAGKIGLKIVDGQVCMVRLDATQ